jgi:hypothetical protein
MKKLFLLFMLGMSTLLHSQTKRIDGNGKLSTRSLLVEQVSKIKVAGSWANVTITCGKMPLLEIYTDANIQPYIQVSNTNDLLAITATENAWIEPTHLTIRIQLPYLHALELAGWGNIEIQHLDVERFLFKGDVGSLVVAGEVDTFTIESDQSRVDLQNVSIKQLNVTMTGRGTVVYGGTPLLTVAAAQGIVISTKEQESLKQNSKQDVVSITLYNNSMSKLNLVVEGPPKRNFSYGFALSMYAKKNEDWPVGTKLYLTKSGLVKGTLLHTVTKTDQHKVITLSK